jgi:hypothetical protein
MSAEMPQPNAEVQHGLESCRRKDAWESFDRAAELAGLQFTDLGDVDESADDESDSDIDGGDATDVRD